MNNYIMFKGQKIELTEEQIAQLNQVIETADIKLADIPAGETFKIGEDEFIVLDQMEDRTYVILKSLLKESEEFGDCNNYNDSNVDHICTDFATKISGIIGNDNLLMHTVDLTSDDGLKCYGTVERQMSLITTEMYRRYVEILDMHKLNKWWWIATPYSTPKHEDDEWVKCVSPSGFIDNDDYNYDYGVRPFCILKSDIFVSR